MAPPQHAPLFPTWQYLASCSSRTHLGHTQAALAGMNNHLLELRQSFLCTCSWLLPVDRSLHAWCGRQRGVHPGRPVHAASRPVRAGGPPTRIHAAGWLQCDVFLLGPGCPALMPWCLTL